MMVACDEVDPRAAGRDVDDLGTQLGRQSSDVQVASGPREEVCAGVALSSIFAPDRTRLVRGRQV